MRKHIKLRGDINFDPKEIKITRIRFGRVHPKIADEESPSKNSTGFQKSPRAKIQSSKPAPENIYHTPFNYKPRTSFKDASTQDNTQTQSCQSVFESRHDLFATPPQYQRKSLVPFSNDPKQERQNRLMVRTRARSKNILHTREDELSLDSHESQQKRGSSEEIVRLRRENAELKRLLGQCWSCGCKSPYVNEEVEYLRVNMLSHYKTRCCYHENKI